MNDAPVTDTPPLQHDARNATATRDSEDSGTNEEIARESLESISVRLISHTNLQLLAFECATTTVETKQKSEVFARVRIAPGNQSVSTSMLQIDAESGSSQLWGETVALQVAPVLQTSSVLDALELVVEVWEHVSGLSHEMVGNGRVSMAKILEKQENESSSRLDLVRMSDSGYAGSIDLSATLTTNLACRTLERIDYSGDKLRFASGAPDGWDDSIDTLVVALVACRGLKVSLWFGCSLCE